MIYLTVTLLFISIILEGIIPNLLRDIFPLFTVAIIIISSTFKIDDKEFYISIFLSGVVYDLFYTSTLFLNGFIFVFLAYLSKMLVDKNINFIKALLYYYLLSFLYIIIMFYFTYFYVPKSLIYIITIYKNNMIINSLYFSLSYLVLVGLKNITSNSYKKHSYF